jgi:hypothetical protein
MRVTKHLMSTLKLPLMFALLLACAPIVTVRWGNATPLQQSQSAKPLRIGGAQQLSEHDIASLESLMPAGKIPWLYWGELDVLDWDNIDAIATVGAYLPPASETSELRTGTVITLGWPDHSPSKAWTVIEANGAYAQVAIAGKSFDQIQGDQDINRPFRVVGTFDDAELLSIVTFVRTKYPRFLLRGMERDRLNHVLVSVASGHDGLVRLLLDYQSQGWVLLSRQVINVRLPHSQSGNLTPLQNILRHAEIAPRFR